MLGRLAVGLVKAYKRYLSPMLPASCRFTPSCSQYAIDAISKYGVLKGSAKACWRVMRCHPFSRGGSDPVK
ncbi:membrane protein insertion efficiency factor YidD [Rubrobacter aplysinae]|uniref:membrane protein insertion efficiency factor YidD n=1 Tax=Rubrobacter aplysinae TaxID=909625 RepID=UPI0009FBCBB1|nr:membrane protein insertion efficiency factor YidD [Rubrobacter aplysinae]